MGDGWGLVGCRGCPWVRMVVFGAEISRDGWTCLGMGGGSGFWDKGTVGGGFTF